MSSDSRETFCRCEDSFAGSIPEDPADSKRSGPGEPPTGVLRAEPGATFVDVAKADRVAALAGNGSALTLVVQDGDKAASRSFTATLLACSVTTFLIPLGG